MNIERRVVLSLTRIVKNTNYTIMSIVNTHPSKILVDSILNCLSIYPFASQIFLCLFITFSM